MSFVIVLALLESRLIIEGMSPEYRVRDFYGIVRVVQEEGVRNLYHGTTLHGIAEVPFPEELNPSTYYTPNAGIGQAVRSRQEAGPVRVGMVGLGTGTVGSYCRPGDEFTFFELDPQVERVAREFFPYLDYCAGTQVVLGDARRSLARTEGEQRFDLLAIDAFSDDSIPIHLLTSEALELYFSQLAPGGLLVVHVTNRYFELAPYVIATAQAHNAHAVTVVDDEDAYPRGEFSLWVVIARPSEELPPLEQIVHTESASQIWTDDMANPLAALNWSWLFSTLKN